ncbi:inorganic pyrophosphatase [Candidatus Xenohaliotis californiensis]|uniref:Inorganic pyrophosphatase n=1 Tax=Candidatus Xenohaliotis californiensis TaxID=84677 RepID=A0ABP0EXT2_9RICK|nr:inorganic pyrophosphatase [Candidatus Xenohaliotis californiensis]
MKNENFEVIIEISENSSAVKYEIDKKTGLLSVDRMLKTSMHYPCNYGFISNTLSEDNDPCDALVISSNPILPNASVLCRAVGVLMMEDEAGNDEKIICTPIKKIDPFYDFINDINDINKHTLRRIKHFFEHYKDIDDDKWVKVKSWGNAENAYQMINDAFKRALSK